MNAIDAQPDAGTPRLDTRRVLWLVLAVALAWNLIGNLLLPGAWYVPANLTVAAALVALARRAGVGWERLGLGRGQIGRGATVGLSAAAVVALVLAVALLVPAAEGALEDDNVRADPTFDRWFVPLVRIPLGTALFEEILFRSVLLGLLLGWTSPRRAIVVSSLAFGLWHIVPALEGAGGSMVATLGSVAGIVAITTVAGVMFAGLRLWSGSVLAPILAHTATNSFAYVAALVAIESVG